MRSTLKAVAGLFVLLLTSACFVETEATLGDGDKQSFDQRLVGAWYSGKGGEAVVISIVPDVQREGAYRAVFVSVNPFTDRDVEGTRYSVTRTVINGQSYLSLRRAGGSTELPAQTIISYDLRDDGTLVLRLLDPKQVIAAIEAGKLKGTFKKGQYVDEAKIAAPRAELAAFIAGADRDKLFGQKSDPLHKLADTGK